ncbi:MAG: VOC family protein [Chloroflexi bacterium]|nr:VOC family protein [Chloroflexota bacterium]
MATFPVRRLGCILAVSDVDRSVAFYTNHLGFAVDALYDDPPYATLTREGIRLSLAEQGHPAPDRPGIAMAVPPDVAQLPVVIVLEVDDAMAVHAQLAVEGVAFLAEPWEAPWGGSRFFVKDPDGYLVELEQPG